MIPSLVRSVLSQPYKVFSLAIIFANMLAFSAIVGFYPAARPYILGEDQVVENLSALFFFASFVFALVLLRHQVVHRRILVAVALLGLVGFLDEVSFGGRIVGVEFPELYGSPFDGIHDILMIAFEWTREQVGNLVFLFLFIAVFAAGALSFIWVRRHLTKPGHFFEYLDAYFFGGLFCFFLSVALLIDLDIFEGGPTHLMEELFEMNAGLTLFLYCAGKWKLRNLETQSRAG